MLTIKYKNNQSLETTHNVDPVLCLTGWHDWRNEKNNEWFWTAPWWLPAVIATYLCWNSFFLLTLSDTIICACSRRSIFCQSSKTEKQMPWSLTFKIWNTTHLPRTISAGTATLIVSVIIIYYVSLGMDYRSVHARTSACVCCCWTEYHKTIRNSADPPCTTGKESGRTSADTTWHSPSCTKESDRTSADTTWHSPPCTKESDRTSADTTWHSPPCTTESDRTSADTTWHSPPCTKESGRTSADTTWRPVQQEKKVTAIQLIKCDTLHPVQEESDSNSADKIGHSSHCTS